SGLSLAARPADGKALFSPVSAGVPHRLRRVAGDQQRQRPIRASDDDYAGAACPCAFMLPKLCAFPSENPLKNSTTLG
ncbi:MAG TPA: hypothetical protein VGN52_13420, partial [Burkholderiales bacterium]